MPDPTAGCYLADTATPEAVQAAWERLDAVMGDAERRGDADHLHQLVGGAQGILRAARRHRVHLQQRRAGHPLGAGAAAARLLFPRPAPGAQHRQAAGHRLWRRCSSWDRHRPLPQRGNPARAQGHALARLPATCTSASCPEHVAAVRERCPGIRVLVHPECPMEVVDLADDVRVDLGTSSARSRRRRPARRWAIGTESTAGAAPADSNIRSSRSSPWPACRRSARRWPRSHCDKLAARAGGAGCAARSSTR